jgi:hypothetical protein
MKSVVANKIADAGTVPGSSFRSPNLSGQLTVNLGWTATSVATARPSAAWPS